MRGLTTAILVAVVSQVANAAETIPGDQAQSKGVRTCLATIDKMAKHVVENKKHASLASWNNKSPNSRLFNSQISVRYSDGNSVAIINAAPTTDGKCDASYTNIWAWDISCAVIRETQLKDWKYSGELAGVVVLESQNGAVSEILLPTPDGAGCTVIKTEVLYE